MDQHALLKPITRTWLVERHSDVIRTIYEAVRVATSGEAGPVFSSDPVNLQLMTGDAARSGVSGTRRGRSTLGTAAPVRGGWRLLAAAKSPGIFVGWGAVDASREWPVRGATPAPRSRPRCKAECVPSEPPLHAGFCLGRAAVPAAESVQGLRLHASRRRPLRRDCHGKATGTSPAPDPR